MPNKTMRIQDNSFQILKLTGEQIAVMRNLAKRQRDNGNNADIEFSPNCFSGSGKLTEPALYLVSEGDVRFISDALQDGSVILAILSSYKERFHNAVLVSANMYCRWEAVGGNAGLIFVAGQDNVITVLASGDPAHK